MMYRRYIQTVQSTFLSNFKQNKAKYIALIPFVDIILAKGFFVKLVVFSL